MHRFRTRGRHPRPTDERTVTPMTTPDQQPVSDAEAREALREAARDGMDESLYTALASYIDQQAALRAQLAEMTAERDRHLSHANEGWRLVNKRTAEWKA